MGCKLLAFDKHYVGLISNTIAKSAFDGIPLLIKLGNYLLVGFTLKARVSILLFNFYYLGFASPMADEYLAST
jgi:hypothetical protein